MSLSWRTSTRGWGCRAPLVVCRAALLLTAVWGFGACASFQEGPAHITVKGLTFVEVDGWQIHVETVGDQGEPLVLIHGYSSALMEWHKVTPALCKRYRCILLDLPGFGWSDKREGNYSPEQMARFVFGVMDKMGVSKAHVVGHSWGASVALAMAHLRARAVGSLVLVGPWVYYDQLPTFMLWSRVPILGEFLFTAFFAQQPELRYEQIYFEPDAHVTQEHIDIMKRGLQWQGVKRAALQAARDQLLEETEKNYPNIAHPTLLVWGEQDQVADPFYAGRLQSDLGNSRLVTVPRCGHVPQMERPHLFVSHVIDFLAAQEVDHEVR